MILRVLILARFGFLELLRSRIYLNVLAAGVALVLAALAFEELSASQGGRVLADVGLAFISLVVAALAGIVPLTTVAREIETRQVHILVARPIGRGEYVAGRYLAAALLVLVSNLVLGGLLAGLLFATTGSPQVGQVFFAAVFCSFEGFIVAALAMVFGVSSSTAMSAVFLTATFVLGRLTDALRDVVATKLSEPLASVVGASTWVLPWLPLFDLTRTLHGELLTATWLLQAVAYAVVYVVALLFVASWRLRRRDLL